MMSNRSLSCTVVAVGIGAALISGCAAGSAAAGNSTAKSTTSAATSANSPAGTSAPAGTGTVTGTAPTAATSTPADTARTMALRACTTWKIADGQSAAEGSGTMDRAAASARGAARSTPRWAPLASDMTFVASLPETDNTAANVAKAQKALGRISTVCAGIGVPGIHD